MNSVIKEDIEAILRASVAWEKFRDATVLIAGATSMLGSYMVYTLAELQRRHPQYRIKLVLGARSREKAEKFFGGLLDRPEVSLWLADLGGVFNYEGRADYIVHAAGLASSHLFLSRPVDVALPNVIGTWQLLELARRERARGFLFFSSGAVYGKLEGTGAIREEDGGALQPMEVRNCYGESKRMGENLCADYAAQHQVPACSVRIGHTYGPTMDLNDSRVFSEFVRNVVNNEDIVMKSDGTAKRPFCYLSDAAAAFFLILLHGRPGQAYNMCDNGGLLSIGELADLLCALFPEKNLRVVRQEREAGDTYSEDKTAGACPVDCGRLHALGWQPRVGPREGFARTVRSFLDGQAKI